MFGQQEPHQHIVFVVALFATGLAGSLDWRRGEIPNWLTYGMILVGPLLHVIRFLSVHVPLEGALVEGGHSIVGALVCLIVPAILYRQGAIGGGDVKLLAGIGALLQTTLGVEAEMYGFFAATLVAPAMLAYRGKLIETLKNALSIGANAFLPKTKQRSVDETALSWFRLGPALFFGVALTAYLHW